MYYSIVEISMFVEHGKLYYFVMANYTILSWQFSTRILPWLFSVCRPKEHGNFPFCSMVNLFFITMANFILHLLLQIFLFLTHGKFTFTAMAKLHILPWQFFYFWTWQIYFYPMKKNLTPNHGKLYIWNMASFINLTMWKTKCFGPWQICFMYHSTSPYGPNQKKFGTIANFFLPRPWQFHFMGPCWT